MTAYAVFAARMLLGKYRLGIVAHRCCRQFSTPNTWSTSTGLGPRPIRESTPSSPQRISKTSSAHNDIRRYFFLPGCGPDQHKKPPPGFDCKSTGPGLRRSVEHSTNPYFCFFFALTFAALEGSTRPQDKEKMSVGSKRIVLVIKTSPQAAPRLHSCDALPASPENFSLPIPWHASI